VTRTVDYTALHQTQTWQLYEYYIARFEQDHSTELAGATVEDQGRGEVVYRDPAGKELARFDYSTLKGYLA
jgi:hypothetical protein